MQGTEWDYIVVGAGSAGCVVASRLSEDRALRVLLVEAGGVDRSPTIHIPGLLPQVIRSKTLNWHYRGDPDPTLNGRSLTWAGGRTLGGSSSINGMVFVRGLRACFDEWADNGMTGWGWEDLLPYFRRMENWAGEPGPARGQGGPLQVRRFEKTDRACSAWVESALHQELAPYVTDHNVGINEGISLNQASQFAGRRSSAAIAYVRPALKRGALEVKTGVFVEKLLLSGGRCTGIEVRTETGTQQWRARREVIVCGGAIASPKLLMLSGIGAAESLEPHGIKVLHELRGVGANLNEHINIKLSASSTTRTYSSEKKGWRQAANGARWMVSRDGPASSPVGHVQAFFKTDPALAAADIQVQVIPMGFDRAYTMDVDAVSSVISLCQPKARGRISLRSADPAAAPHITIPLLSDDDDVRRLARACDMVRSVHASAKLRGAMGDELSPGPGTGGSLDAWRAVLQEFGGLNWHPTSTCRMGNGPDDVVDLALKVHGIDGLRIIDGSVMPSVTSGNTNAPIIAMAEKAADLIASSVH